MHHRCEHNSNMICLRNKTSVPVFYRGNKVRVRVRVGMNLITSGHNSLIVCECILNSVDRKVYFVMMHTSVRL